MKKTFILKPTETKFSIDKHFPKLINGKKAGIFLSGGMESSLISIIASRIYSKENVIFFFSDNIFSSNNPLTNTSIHTNIKRATKLLNISPIYLDFDYDDHVTNRKLSVEKKIKKLEVDYNVQFVMFGFTKLFFEVEIFKQNGLSKEKILEIAFSDPSKYKSTIEEFHLETGRYVDLLLEIDIPKEVFPLLRNSSNFIKSPFKDLNKSEVVDFYRQLDLLDILYETSSCIRDSLTKTNKHCGACFNCQQRHDAFKILNDGIEDLTEYSSDEVKNYRKQLEEIRNEIHT